ncbi:MAG: sugar transferase [Acidobacteria bacterium]|nr:sugar transferase [Acidobacteriota bacterium]
MQTLTRPAAVGVAAVPSAPPKRWRRMAKAALVATDAATVATGLLLAFLTRAELIGADVWRARRDHLVLGLVALPVWLFLFARGRLYSTRFIERRAEELRRLAHAAVSAVGVMAATGYALRLTVSRAWLVLALVETTGLLVVERHIARVVFDHLRRGRRMLRSVVIVGSNAEATELAEMLNDDPRFGYVVLGIVEDRAGPSATLDLVRATGADSVIVAASSTNIRLTNRIARELLNEGVHVELSSPLRDISAERLSVRLLGRSPIIYLEPRRLGGWRALAKRAFDLVVATTGVVLLAPIWLVVSIRIRLDSPGPVFFRQDRIGKDGRMFQVWKFRTMVADAEGQLESLRARNEADGPLFKLRDDPRVTRFGRFLRRKSLDELPQLLNVIRGEMSLVGPRPALPGELAAWSPELRARLRVRPGITGMWQVHGRSDASFERYTRDDLYYVDNWSLTTDLTLLARTIPAVVSGHGAY